MRTSSQRASVGSGIDTVDKRAAATRVFRYVVTHFTGFAPCFEARVCTLACCKPSIRRSADVGDWVLGFAPSRSGNARLLYAMRVDEKLDFNAYAIDPRFDGRGDNVWRPDRRGGFRYAGSHGIHNTSKDQDKDVWRGKYVLVSHYYRCFGTDGVDLCQKLKAEIARRLWFPGRGHKVNGLLYTDLAAFKAFFDRASNGQHPALMPKVADPGERPSVRARGCR